MSGAISEAAVSLPTPALRPWIAQYAGFHAAGVPPGLHFGLPSTAIDLIISLDAPIDVVKMPNAAQQPEAFTALVTGLQTAPAVIRQGGEVFGLHVFIQPFAVRSILGVASAELSSLVVHLSNIWGNRAGDIVEMLRAARTWPERFAILDRAFLAKLKPASADPAIAWAWQRLAQSRGSLSVQRLADETGYGRRHFTDRFRDLIGVAPKSAARVFRFKRACRMIADQRPSLAHVAIACGYYDQAHLTREWNALAGCSPREWIARELPFLQDYELGDGDNEPDDFESVHQSFV